MGICISGEKTNMQDEKVILITIIGILEAVSKRAITIDEAEKCLFSPHSI